MPLFSKKKEGIQLKQKKTPYLFLAPFFLTYLTFHLFPQLYSIWISFFDYRYGKVNGFVGLRNFSMAFGDVTFLKSLVNTAIFWLATLPVQLLLAFLIAAFMMNMAPRLRGMLSGFYYLPTVTNLVAVIMVFQLMFDENFGILNYLLNLIGLEGIPWLTDPFWAKLSTILVIIWRGLGYYVVYILAGLMGVDKALYEYAKLEGASFWKKHIYVTLPLIKPILLFLTFSGTIAGWNIFLEPFLLFNKSGMPLGNGGPLQSCLTSAIYIYTEGFTNLKYGYGAAMSLIISVITTIFAILQFKLLETGKEV